MHCFLTIFHTSITSLETPPKMRRQSSRTTAIPPMSTKGLPEIEHATKDTAKPLPGHPTPESIGESEKEAKAHLQEMSNKLTENQDKPINTAKPRPGQPRPEKVGDSAKGGEAQLQEVSTKPSENQDKLSPKTKTKTPLKSAQNKKGSDKDEDKESLDPEIHSTEEQVNSLPS